MQTVFPWYYKIGRRLQDIWIVYFTGYVPGTYLPVFYGTHRPYEEITDVYYLYHSCGSIYLLLEDIIKCGVDIVNPLQLKALNIAPDKLAFILVNVNQQREKR